MSSYQKFSLNTFRGKLKDQSYDTLAGANRAIGKMRELSDAERNKARILAAAHFGADVPSKAAKKATKKVVKKAAKRAAKVVKKVAKRVAKAVAAPVAARKVAKKTAKKVAKKKAARALFVVPHMAEKDTTPPTRAPKGEGKSVV